MAIATAPFGEMPSNQEIMRRISALLPQAAQNTPGQHLVSEVILSSSQSRGERNLSPSWQA